MGLSYSFLRNIWTHMLISFVALNSLYPFTNHKILLSFEFRYFIAFTIPFNFEAWLCIAIVNFSLFLTFDTDACSRTLKLLCESKSSHRHCKICFFVYSDLMLVMLTGYFYLAKVGLSGSGKSTLVNLLLRLYEPSSGQVNYLYLSVLVNWNWMCVRASKLRVGIHLF